MYLVYLFERASFNAIRVTLLLHIFSLYNLDTKHTFLILSSMLSLNLIIPLFLAKLFDTFNNVKNILVIALLLLMAGNILLIFEELSYLTLSISLITCGSSMCRLMISSFIAKNNLFVYKFNTLLISGSIGSMIGIIFFASLGEVYGWRYCYILSSLFLLFSLIYTKIYFYSVNYNITEMIKLSKFVSIIILISYIIISNINLDLILFCLLIIITLVFYNIINLKNNIKVKSLVSNIILVNFCFTISFIQSETYLVLFIDKYVNRTLYFSIYKILIPITLFQMLVPIFNLLLFKIKLFLKANKFNNFYKLNLGLFFSSISMITLYFSYELTNFSKSNINLNWIVIAMLFLSISETLIVPTSMEILNSIAENNQNFYFGLYYSFEGYAVLFSVLLNDIINSKTLILTKTNENINFLFISIFCFIVNLISLLVQILMNNTKSQ
jgi:dipeptide/tripeptide permease